jgi:hypothetical protein
MPAHRWIAVALIGAAALVLSSHNASACISFDRKAEMRAIDKAIARRSTPTETRAKLRRLRDTIKRERTFVAQHNATTEALELIGLKRIRRETPASAGALAPGAILPQGAGPERCG